MREPAGVAHGATVERDRRGARAALAAPGRPRCPRPRLDGRSPWSRRSAGALDPRLRPGDLVVATEVRDVAGAPPVPVPARRAARRRAAPARAAGASRARRCHAPTVVARRAARGGAGAARARSPSTWSRPWLARGAPPARPFAVVRAVVDTAEEPLLRPGTPCARAGAPCARCASPRRRSSEWARGHRAARPWCWRRRGRSAPASSGRSTRWSGRSTASAHRSTCAGRSCTTPTSSPSWRGAGRSSCRSSTRCPTAPRRARRPRGRRRPCGPGPRSAQLASSTPPVRWSPRCTARCAATPAGATPCSSSATPTTRRSIGTVGEAPDDVVVVDERGRGRHRRGPPTRRGSPTRCRRRSPSTRPSRDRARCSATRFPALAAPPTEDICYATTNRQQAVRAMAARVRPRARRGFAPTRRTPGGSPRWPAAPARAPVLRRRRRRAATWTWLAGAGTIGVTAGASAPPGWSTSSSRCLAGLGPVTDRRTRDVVARTSGSPCPRR